MGRTVVFANQKGGVGKTTSTINIGAYMAAKGKRVLLVDLDPQGNLSSGLGVYEKTSGIYDVLIGKVPAAEAIVKTPQENMYILPSDLSLTGAMVELANVEDRNCFLKRAINSQISAFDYILIDCPPSLGILTLNGFVAAQVVIVPLQCEFFALEGFMSMLSQTIKRVQVSLNTRLLVGGIIFTMYDSRTRIAQEVIQQMKEAFKKNPTLLFKTVIPRNIRLAEAPSHGIPINIYDPLCIGARSYAALTEEVLRRV
ncbi:Chromosome (plasmid) partitioning protein ParA [Olavius algarvensis spirochete endosymbiont]|uniref:ParA family protein n=1 Tax=Olavius algarvensis spirochete endosymbiont TaxID=260710 RepID=UPI000F213509|nr:ParA family protein [Olavius algarvensis spirochete endosymbiont]CAD7844399.1 MAG: Chromosome (plasmid) partitioning protein ParA [Olavius algarvensis spirochete endosymbiont]VDA99643.1 Chromosome (plasmid) partitioning protein ParA [Olavius algarvensis spirochete endosymbiont]